jgi:type VI secretion system secreted protein VgrG
VADDFTQANRRLRIATPLGPDALLITALTGTEGVSTLFHFQAELLGRDEKADFDAIVGKGVTISVAAGGGDRYFHGVVSRFAQSGTVGRHATYRADIVPWLWFLTRTSDCRIFQKKSVPDIVKQLFGEYGFADYRFRLTGSYEPREYCVQYRETDFNFVTRLLEEEGIFFFFEHEDDKHTLLVADSARAHESCPVLDSVRFVHEQVSLGEDDVVTLFSKEQEVRAAKVAHTDYNFETPSLDLAASATGSDSRKYELYDYPAYATKRDRADALARVRQQEEDATRVLFRGAGYVRSLTPGYKFSLRARGDGVPTTFDGSYVLTAVRHRASESYASGEESNVSYENDFECIEAAVPFRPARHTPRPVIHGVQPAVVVGPAGEEIFVDKYGRVKVQFFWDREGKRDENSSCWLRVSQPWAGKGWGGVSIPRIGQEVIISFVEGDPDQPIIVGRVYNGEQMPPYAFPAGGVVSGLKSQTHKGKGSNELSMDDTAGKEKITIHGQYDMNTTVEHDQMNKINNNRSTTVVVDDALNVDANRTVHVKAKLKETIDGGQEVTVSSGYKETITGGATSEISGGLTSTVNGKWDNTINGHLKEIVSSGAEQSVTGDAKIDATAKIDIHAGAPGTYTSDASLKFAVAGSVIEITPGGITISMGASSVKVDPAGVTVMGPKISLNG